MKQSENFIDQLNELLSTKKDCIVNIINDKLTLSVFSKLQANLSNVKEINFILRDTTFIPKQQELSHEFEININETLFNAYDIIEKNNLTHLNKAKTMYNFIKGHVNVKRTNNKDLVRGNLITINNDFMIQGSSSLEIPTVKGKNHIKSFNFDSVIDSNMDGKQILEANKKFTIIWNTPEYTVDFKEELLKSLEYLYKEHSPEFLYYYTLNDLFSPQLSEEGISRFQNDASKFQSTEIWKKLYPFQRDAVMTAIQKIHKYNGCIIADSVGLGKTFEALAIIKYFEMRQDNVLVLTPRKLYDNWNSFKGIYKNSFLDERFDYKIMCHTDLSRYSGTSVSSYDLDRFDWGKYDLLVIDESHNFRNRKETDDGHITRYHRLMEEVIKANKKTKVLLLSATPVNNSLTDLKNQLSIITADRNDFFVEEGIADISNLLTQTTRQINIWNKLPDKNKEQLYDMLPTNFYKLLDLMTIARSRRHITNSYGLEEIGSFPEKLIPITFHPNVDTQEELLQVEKTNIQLEDLLMAVYTPMKYIKPQFKALYHEKYKTKVNGRDVFFHEDREFYTAVLQRFNLFKRLDSSVYAFSETLHRLLEKIDSFMNTLNKSYLSLTVEDEEDENEEIDNCLDYKYEIEVKHLDKIKFLAELSFDRKIVEDIYKESQKILQNKRDNKLSKLKQVLQDKIQNTPYNTGNKKVLIFTAFADTANYLYDNLINFAQRNNLVIATVTGSGSPRCTYNPHKRALSFEDILCRFSPKSKLRETLPPEQQVDILIATDCISEGQNLQDCDCVINYDIQWNPVALIQRFGRIDRIGSTNKQIQMINFFPDVNLNDYLQLESRVKNKMVQVNIAATGDENILDKGMNDITFRQKQLERLQEEVIDIDEAKDGISLTDFNLNDYLYEVASYIKQNKEINRTPHGIYSITNAEQKGVIFCFKHKNIDMKPKNESSLYPYYLIFIGTDGNIIIHNTQVRDLLKQFRNLCYQKNTIDDNIFKEFYKETNNIKDMSFYSALLTKGIQSIQGKEVEQAKQTIFDFTGYDNAFSNETTENFELISFLVVK